MQENITLTPVQEAELKKRLDLDAKIIAQAPKRADFPAGEDGDFDCAQARQKFFTAYFEKPENFADPEKRTKNKLPDILKGEDLKLAEQMAQDTQSRLSKAKEKLAAVKSRTAASVARIDAKFFGSYMSEDDVIEFIRDATLAQVKAVLASDRWQEDEKRHMIEKRWKNELEEFAKLDESRREWKSKMAPIWKSIGNGDMEYTKAMKDTEDGPVEILVPSRVATDKKTGKKYAYDKHDNAFEMPDEPALQSHLRNWIRNEMTKAEFEIAASISPEMFSNPTLVQVIRWPIIFKEFRTDEAFPYEMRQGMTYLKDGDLMPLVDPKDPNYLPENTETERTEAYKKAAEAAEREPEASKDKKFREVYEKLLPKDAVRNMRINEWLKGRALGEVPRGKFRNTIVYHRLLDKAKGKKMGGNDGHEIMGEDGFITNMLKDYLDEKAGRGLVTDSNRTLLEYIFCDVRSTDIPRDVNSLPSEELRELYRELEHEGRTTGTLKFYSDKVRGIKSGKKKGKGGDEEE